METTRQWKKEDGRRRSTAGKKMRADGKRKKMDKFLQLKQQVNDLIQFGYFKKVF